MTEASTRSRVRLVSRNLAQVTTARKMNNVTNTSLVT